jgi:osmoprotectant transport system permease protein
MVPLLGALGLVGIGFLPAFIALVLYSMLPVLRNTVTGLTTIDPAVVEAARGVGMSPWARLMRVELPLALPVIVAGVRTATVWTVGAATLATPVGATSLGNYIFRGLQTRNTAAILMGCLASAALALALDGLSALLVRGVKRRRRGQIIAALGIVVLLYAYAIWAATPSLSASARPPIVVGAKTFSEQYILANLLAERVRQSSDGVEAEVKSSLGSSVVFDALAEGAIDVYVDYSGTIWANVMKRSGVPRDRARVLDEVRQYLKERYDIVLLAALGFENAYALAMARSRAERLGVSTVSDLAAVAPRLQIGGDYEFFGRPEWKALEETYGLRFSAKRSMDSSLMYQAAAQGTVDVISAFTTDGRIVAFDLKVVDDDRGVIPPYDAIVLGNGRFVRDHPTLARSLRALDGTIDANHMRRMNLEVDEKKRAPADVAREFMRELPDEQ